MNTGHRIDPLAGRRRLRCSRRCVGGAFAQGAQPPISIGSTLALTGPLAATGLVHKVVGEIYVEQLNKRGGLLGRPVEWIVKDDQSKPDLARTLYEQLITVDKVDLLMGPYATGAILSAMGVAQRYNKVLVHHTFGIPSLAKYDEQFPAWSLGPDPGEHVAEHAVRRAGRIAQAAEDDRRSSRASSRRCTSCRSARAKSRRSAGSTRCCSSNGTSATSTTAPIAARIKDAKPDFVWVGAIGLEGNQLLEAMKKIDYAPQRALLHVSGARTDVEVAAGEERAVDDGLRGASRRTPTRRAPTDSSTLYHERAAKAGHSRHQRRSAGRGVVHGVADPRSRRCAATNSLDDTKIAAWLRANKVDTIQGKLRFDGPSNYGDDLMRVKQVQNGRWVTVCPKEYAAPGATLLVQ